MSANSRWIDIKAADGGTFQGYLSLPVAGKGPAIVLLQEIFGVNAHIRSVADSYAADGYVVIAPDLFWRSEPHVELGYDEAGRDRGIALMQAEPLPTFVSDIGAVVSALRAMPEVTGKVATIGYCFGGLLAYFAAADTGVDAAVAYYGGGIQNQLDAASRVKTPMMFHYGEKDSHIPLTAVSEVEAAFKGHPNTTFHIYAGAEHGFNASVRASYQQRAAALAHGRTLIFLAENL
ncbi:MAG: dienelactone hydrolase family protein [Janthinobacterium lividum]